MAASGCHGHVPVGPGTAEPGHCRRGPAAWAVPMSAKWHGAVCHWHWQRASASASAGAQSRRPGPGHSESAPPEQHAMPTGTVTVLEAGPHRVLFNNTDGQYPSESMSAGQGHEASF